MKLSSEAQDLLFREARTANAFTDEPVSDEQMRAVYDLVKYAPTAMNSQPLRVLLVRSAEARERLVSHMSPGNQAKTLAAPLVAVLAADLDFHHELPKVFPIAPAAKDTFEANESGRVGMARFNSALQTGYFIVGVRAAGLSAGPMTGFDADALSKEFFPDGDHAVLAVVNLGRPAAEGAWFGRQPRLDYDEVVSVV
ncbi:malonic semialdehyde reductase [Nonomuraea sp. NBC_01738]|uniref:malonic semialdehyde reductase n=1 Tax=Nonomuraea sp. NBC_01738 TaxID=2976003 RepID=UPI002E11C442|nr:malonic semialdehyde reductase [Nonomuraea sp. NBC_01738]